MRNTTTRARRRMLAGPLSVLLPALTGGIALAAAGGGAASPPRPAARPDGRGHHGTTPRSAPCQHQRPWRL
jgi:hypothetical protein